MLKLMENNFGSYWQSWSYREKRAFHQCSSQFCKHPSRKFAPFRTWYRRNYLTRLPYSPRGGRFGRHPRRRWSRCRRTPLRSSSRSHMCRRCIPVRYHNWNPQPAPSRMSLQTRSGRIRTRSLGSPRRWKSRRRKLNNPPRTYPRHSIDRHRTMCHYRRSTSQTVALLACRFRRY